MRLGVTKYSKHDVLLLEELVESESYRAVIDRTYPLEDVVEASKYVETGQKTGNVVLTVSHDARRLVESRASPSKEEQMDHAATMRRAYDLINAGDIDGFGDLLADDFVEHEDTPGLEPTKEGVKAFFHMYRAAFPDLRFEPQDVLPSGDKVVTRARVTGTHQGEFMGIAATGKRIDVELVDIVRFGDDGLGQEHWGVFDAMAMMQQLGVVPEGPPT